MIVTRKNWFASSLLLTLILAPSVHAQNSSPVTWSASVKNKSQDYRPGQKLLVALRAGIDPGWHVYALTEPPGSFVIPTTIALDRGQPFDLAGKIISPAPISRTDPTVGATLQFYENEAEFTVPLKIEKKASAGKQSVKFDVSYQACNNRVCLPPRKVGVTAAVEIASHGQK
jgi:DsbC/DsbD-like thiol-disulfide interchange protein